MRTYIQKEVAKTLATLELLARDEAITAEVEKVARTCCAALRAGNKILFAGNGGSAADAQHLAGELVSRLNFDRPGLAAFALTTDSSVVTAIGNDYGYNCVFARQLNAVGAAGDVFFAISTSGRSANILRGLEEGRRKGLITVGLTGMSGGEMAPLCDYCIRVPSSETPKIQEGHIMLGHIICGLIERETFGGD
ncbi:MAG TPA: D-sedoheptulose 7-phosphate isomerase [Bryobacteraceae bacterium]|nr:D-sedoheptulose 7-phosphate isomerase [Bryobacteraceae bacterium]